MEFVVLGAGGIGAVVGGRLLQSGRKVTLLARGAHLAALRTRGLRLESPAGTDVLSVQVAGGPGELEWHDDHIVLLAVKSHQTMAALTELAAVAPATTPIVCLQNGIANEPAALRLFRNVYGVAVVCPTGYLEPGVVQAWSTPVTGLLDVARYPAGIDDTARLVAEALAGATFDAHAIDDTRPWKRRKLLVNLGNAIEAVCGPEAREGRLQEVLVAEGEAALAAAGLETATAAQDRIRRGDLLRRGLINGRSRPGGSSWQSLHRHTGDIETDFLNGEIVLLGRLHGVPTPANELLQHLARECATGRRAPCSVPEAAVLDRLARAPAASAATGPVRRPGSTSRA